MNRQNAMAIAADINALTSHNSDFDLKDAEFVFLALASEHGADNVMNFLAVLGYYANTSGLGSMQKCIIGAIIDAMDGEERENCGRVIDRVEADEFALSLIISTAIRKTKPFKKNGVSA